VFPQAVLAVYQFLTDRAIGFLVPNHGTQSGSAGRFSSQPFVIQFVRDALLLMPRDKSNHWQ
jgi:hypothetical protein